MRIGFRSSRPHFGDHLYPVLAAAEARGHEIVDVAPDLTLVASSADMRDALRAREAVVLMQHGVGQSYKGRHSSYPGGRGQERASLVLMPNNVALNRHRQFLTNPAEVIGSPRVDHLRKLRNLAGGFTPVVVITWHWPCKAVGKEGGTAFYNIGDAVLDELVVMAERGDIYLFGHAHPRGVEMVADAYEQRGITFIKDFEWVVQCADLLIADNTSVLYEFPAATDRPVVVLDSPEWRRNLTMPPRFWAYADVGPRTSIPSRVPEMVRRALGHEPDDVARRRAITEDLFPFPGEAAGRAVTAIERHFAR